jgi:hypothetical protein
VDKRSRKKTASDFIAETIGERSPILTRSLEPRLRAIQIGLVAEEAPGTLGERLTRWRALLLGAFCHAPHQR